MNDRTTSPPVVELVGATKLFGLTVAVSDVHFGLREGEVVALVGENGAGKSTCVNILGGVHVPDDGELRVDGHQVVFRGPLDAQRAGIAVVHQHPGLFGEMSIAENIFAGRPLRTRLGAIDHAGMQRASTAWLDKLGLHRSPLTPVNALRTSEQQMVEIARALAARARVLILDEPTASLSMTEVDALFHVIEDLREQGVAILFVGHRLEEIFRISNRLVILRDGRHVETVETPRVQQADVVRLMVGRPLDDLYPRRETHPTDVALKVAGLCSAAGLVDISFEIRRGEILGLAGLVGSGRTELARLLFGVDRATDGYIELDGHRVRLRSPSDALAHGVAYVSEDRKGQSLVDDFSILDNATLPVVGRATRAGIIRRRLEISLVAGPLAQMRLKFADYGQPVGTLSGGNQQKVVIAKWLATGPRLLILDEPTQGIDVQAKAEVHRIISALADSGLAILLISSDMPEVLGMSDRLLVMRRGRLVSEFSRATADQEAVALAATGVTPSTVGVEGDTAQPSASREVAVAAPPRASRPAGAARAVRALLRRREAGLLGALLAMVIPIGVLNPRFFSGTNLSSVSGEAALVGVVALGQLLVILTRNIDLSVGSVIGLTAYVFGAFVKDHPDTPILVGVVLALAIGLVCGLFNGVAVAYGRVPSIVVTLGTLYVYRGLDSILSDGKQVSPGDVPESLQDLMSRATLGISTLVILCLALFAAVASVLRWTGRGRQLFQAGSNPDGARLIGVPTQRRVLAAFAVSGLLGGLTGVLWAAHYGIVDGQSAYGLELTVIAAVVVGGAALRGGSGTVLGVALGTILLFVIQNALQLARVDSNSLQAFYGGAIIVAVGIDLVIARRTRTAAAVI